MHGRSAEAALGDARNPPNGHDRVGRQHGKGELMADFIKLTGRYYANGVHGNEFAYDVRCAAIAMVAWKEPRAVISITGVDGTLIVQDEGSIQRLKELLGG